MARLFGGALSLALAILVLRLALPEASQMLSQIVMKILLIISKILDLATNLPPLK